MSIIGIPTTRVSNLFVRQRLTNQMQSDQLGLFQVQTQMSTGHVIQTPSEDAAAALRIMNLQRLIERKGQVQTNLNTNQSYLTATDSTLMAIYGNVAEVRGIALGAMGDTADETQRLAAAQQIQQTLTQLVDAGNQKFRGRYLFAGATTMVRPFELTEDFSVKYNGNEERLASYSDIDLLFDTNVHGSEMFGAISDPVLGLTDLNPALTFNTRLADLRGGEGIADGSIAIGVSTLGVRQTTIVDLSSAETIGDVASMIRDSAPTGKTLDIEITSTGLRIELASAPPDMLAIEEVAGGTTAYDLGILATDTPSPIIGDDLDPIARLTTQVQDLLGSRSQAYTRSIGANNDLIFRAEANGTALNGTQIALTGVPGGPLAVVYDPVAATLAITYDSLLGTTAQQVIDAVAADPTAGALFVAELDQTDGGSNDGTGLIVDSVAPATMASGSGTALDKDSGLQIVNGMRTHSITFAAAETIEDILNTLNMSGAGVFAEINEDATGINIRSRLSGHDFAIGENGGTTAAQLGLRSFTEDTRLDDLAFGRGVTASAGTDFTITTSDGDTIEIDLSQSDGTGLVAQTSMQGLPIMADGTATTPAAIEVMFDGFDNDLIISAVALGSTLNGTEIVFQLVPDTPVAFDHSGGRLTVQFDPGVTTAQDVVDAMAADPLAATFTVALDPANGNVPDTIGELLTLINQDSQNVDAVTGNPLIEARLSTFGNGIELADLTSGAGTLSILQDPNSRAAVSLGLVAEGQRTASGGAAMNSATVDIISLGADNDLTFTAVLPGSSANDIDVVFRPVVGGPAALNLAGNVLTVDYDPGVTDADALVALAAADPNFTAALIARDNDGSGNVAAATGSMSGGTVNTRASATFTFAGNNNDITLSAQASGIGLNDTVITLVDNPGNPIAFTHNAGARTLQIEYDSTAPTRAADIIAALRADPLGVAGGLFEATLNAADGIASDGTGLIRPDGLPATAGGDGATPSTVTVPFAGVDNDLIFTTKPPGGPGVNGIQIAFREVPGGPVATTYIAGQMLIVDFDPGVTTAADIVVAMAADANFTVASDPADVPGTGLGLVAAETLATTAGGSEILAGTDVNPMETESVFTAILRLISALKTGDKWETSRAVELLDKTTLELNFSRAELGARQQGLDVMKYRLEDETIDLRAALSDNFDIDMVEAISNFTGRQIALEASLKTTATIMQMSLLNYL